jgi:acyl-CoA reductase-like NAD-dependent aldehyde dehydrogenase
VVIILPFNYPLCLLCWQAAAALASGNAVIIKPSDLTTLTTLQFIAAFDAFPSGLVQVITGAAPPASSWSSTPTRTWWPSRAASRPDGALRRPADDFTSAP